LQKDDLYFVKQVEFYNEEMEELHSLSGIFQNHGSFKSKMNFTSQLNQLIASKQIMQ